MSTTTKLIAHCANLPVADVNAIARDLGIATYSKDRHSWIVADRDAVALVDHLHEIFPR